MAFMKAMTLGINLRVNNTQALGGMKRMGRSVGFLKKQMMGMGRAISGAYMGVFALVAVSAAFAKGFMAAASASLKFEAQMSAVQAVLLQTKENMASLRSAAIEAGLSTVFTATEAGEALEFLARAGFDANESISALAGVLDMAAAENMDLGRAASITSDVLKGMGMEAHESGRVSDVLALASARTNTNIQKLGEAMQYTAATSSQMGFRLEEVVGAVASLQDQGLKGTIAGTAFNTMLTRMVAPSKEDAKLMKKLGLSFKDARGDALPFAKVLDNLTKGMSKVGGSANKAALANKLFGIRGQQAGLLLVKAWKDADSPLRQLIEDLDKAEGSAGRMAKIRLDNLEGDLKLATAAAESLALIFMEKVTPRLRYATQAATDFIRKMTAGTKDHKKEWEDLTLEVNIYARAIKTAELASIEMLKQTPGAKFGKGFLGVFDKLTTMFDKFIAIIDNAGKSMNKTFGTNLFENLGMAVALFTLFAVVIGPIALMVFLIGGAVVILGEAFLPILAIIALLAVAIGGTLGVAFAASRSDLSVFKQYFEDTVGVIIGLWKGFMDEMMAPSDTTDTTMRHLREAGESLKEALVEVLSVMGIFVEQGEDGAHTYGMMFAGILKGTLQVIAATLRLVAFVIKAGAYLWSAWYSPFAVALKAIFDGFSDLMTRSGSVVDALGTIFGGITHLLFAPFKAAILAILKMSRILFESKFMKAIAASAGIPVNMIIAGHLGLENAVLKMGVPAGHKRRVTNTGGRDSGMGGAERLADLSNIFGDKKTTVEAGIEVPVTVDGDCLGKASAKRKIEIRERSGGSATPWQANVVAFSGEGG